MGISNDLDVLIFVDGIGAAQCTHTEPREGDGTPPRHLSSQIGWSVVSTQSRQPTRLGDYILDRMADLGMRQQKDLAVASGIKEPVISRLIFSQSRPRPDTLNAIARALQVAPAELMQFAYDLADAPAGPTPEALHPTAHRLNQLLGGDSPLGEAARARLNAVITAMLDAEEASDAPPAITPRTRRRHTA